jgi:TolB-like protein
LRLPDGARPDPRRASLSVRGYGRAERQEHRPPCAHFCDYRRRRGVVGTDRHTEAAKAEPPTSEAAAGHTPSFDRRAALHQSFKQEYFADGITDDLTTDLSRISGSFVIARNTAFTYKGKSIDVKQIGRDLGVRFALEGSVRRTGEQVRVNVQLIDAETGTHLWADRFDTDPQNLAQAQSEITGRLARTLSLELVRAADRRIDLEKTINPDALDLVMRGWAAFYRPPSIDTREEARRAFERALEIDPAR